MGTLSTPGTLKILVIGAENLDRIVTVGTQQPYYIIECGKQRSRSKPCLQNGTNPHWNTAHKFELLDETAAVAVIKDEMTKGIIAEGLIDLSRARLSGRDAATAQLRNLAGQPAGLLRFKLKFQPVGAAAAAHAGDTGGRQLHGGGMQHMVDAPVRQYSHDAGGSSLPYSSRRVSETSNSIQRRASEAGSYRSTSSIDGRRSITPSGSLPYGATATALERGPSGGLRASSQNSMSGGVGGVGGLHRRQSGEEPDVVLAAVNSKVSMAKQAMQQLTAELAELTGPGGQQQPPPSAVAHAQQHGRGTVGVSSSPVGSGPGSMPAAQQSAFGAPAVQQSTDSRSSSRQGGGGIGLNVLGQPVHPQQQQQPYQLQTTGQRDAAWGEYKNLWQQQRQQQFPRGPGAAPLGPTESWNTVGHGGDMPVPLYQQQQYDPNQHHHYHHQQQQQYRGAGQFGGRLSTGSLTPSGTYTPSGMLSPNHQLSPQGSSTVMHPMHMAGVPGAEGPGGGVGWPRLRGVFGDGVLSTEELVALYADSGAASEKKLISLLEEALAAAHAEKVATEQELANVKQAMAEVSKQHYLDTKRLKEMTASAAAASTGAAHAAGAGRSVTPPPRFRYDGTPPASPLGGRGTSGGMYSMVDTKPSRRHSRQSDSAELRDLSPLPNRGLTVATGREQQSTAADNKAAAAGAAADAAAAAAASAAELTKLRGEHSRLQAASTALEAEVARLKTQVQRTEDLEKEVERLKQQQTKDSSSKTAAAAAAAGAVGGGAVAAAAAAAELEALRSEHARVRELAEGLEDEVSQLRDAAQQLQDTQQQLEDLQSEHASVKAAFTTTQQQLEKLRQQQLDNRMETRSVRSGSEWQDAAEDFESSSNGGSPMPAYKLQIQVHQLERQLAEQVSKTQEENNKREKLAAELEALQERLDEQVAAAKQAEDNARAAERKAAEQATIAAAARAEVAEVRAHTESSNGKEADLASELASVRDDLDAALADKAELETALGLLDRNSKAQIEQLQAELVKAQEDLGSLREGSSDVATLQAQLAAAQEEASGLRNNSEEVEYLQAQLRRTLRQVVELQRQVQLLQQERSSEASASNPDQEAALEAAIRAETDFLMQELVAAKLELAEVKEQQLITQRQLFKATESMKLQQQPSGGAGIN